MDQLLPGLLLVTRTALSPPPSPPWPPYAPQLETLAPPPAPPLHDSEVNRRNKERGQRIRASAADRSPRGRRDEAQYESPFLPPLMPPSVPPHAPPPYAPQVEWDSWIPPPLPPGLEETSATPSPPEEGQDEWGTTLPPPTPTRTASAEQDPHLAFAHGGRADFRGCDSCLFNFLSARDLSLNVKTEAATFHLNGALVHGTFLTEVHVAFFYRALNTWLNVSYWAKEAGNSNWGWRSVNGSCAGRSFALGPKASRQCYDSIVATGYASAQILLPEWQLNISARRVWKRVDGPLHRLDLAMRPTVTERDLSAWPHGIIGQSYDGDGLPIHGRRDNYSDALVYTAAMAEGAIEGDASEYRVHYAFETEFKYSRFHATMATSRPRSMAKAQHGSAEYVDVQMPALASATEDEGA
eukprot:scaffold107915_cov30-Tisochrysis_lutea.AAC.3